jgi:hypothetical protein
VVLEGTCNPPGLWTTKLEPPLQANASFSALFKATAIKHIHTSLFSPTTQTWTKAIDNNHFSTWPPFNSHEVLQHLPESIATALGRLDQQRKNVRSTKLKHKGKPTGDKESIDDTNPELAEASHMGLANLVKLTDPTHKSYSDLTGRCPVHLEQSVCAFALLMQRECDPRGTPQEQKQGGADQSLSSPYAMYTNASPATSTLDGK